MKAVEALLEGESGKALLVLVLLARARARWPVMP